MRAVLSAASRTGVSRSANGSRRRPAWLRSVSRPGVVDRCAGPLSGCGRRRSAVAVWSVAFLLAAAASSAQDEPQVVLSGIEVAPAAPGPETLCKLTATIRNAGERAVYSFGFDVEVEGHSLPVYEKQLFLQVIEAGESEEVALFNFWTSETGRPVPADGKLEVLVRLREARWVEVSEVDEDGETVEVWTPAGDVSGLPQTVELTLELK